MKVVFSLVVRVTSPPEQKGGGQQFEKIRHLPFVPPMGTVIEDDALSTTRVWTVEHLILQLGHEDDDKDGPCLRVFLGYHDVDRKNAKTIVEWYKDHDWYATKPEFIE